MIFYKVFDARDRERGALITRYFPTLTEAHVAAKALPDRFEAVIEEIDLPTDKASILTLITGGELPETVRRSWTLSPRGGLRIEGLGS